MIALSLQPGASALKRGNGSTGQFRSWQIRGQINIKSSQVDGTLTNYPVLIDEAILNSLPFDIWSIALNGGGDLRFSSDRNGDNRLACEVVTFNTATQVAEIHVNVPSVSPTVDTPIYIFYGKAGVAQPASGAAFGRNATWNSDYIFVNHMDGSTDSTGNTAVQSFAGTVVNGKVGQAVDFNGTSDVIDYFALPGPAGNEATFEFWTDFDALATGTLQAICSTDTNTNAFQVNQRNANNGCGFFGDPPTTVVQSSWNYTLNTWQHSSLLVDSNMPQVTFRLNFSTVSTPAFANVLLDLDGNFTIGAYWDGATMGRFLDGTIDELRISKVLRSLAWRKASYINQNLTTDFLQTQSIISP